MQMIEWCKEKACSPCRENKQMEAYDTRNSTNEVRSESHQSSKRGECLGEPQVVLYRLLPNNPR